MPYNLSLKTVERMQSFLSELLDGRPHTFQSDEPHKLAYNIREAIAAARYNKLMSFAAIDYRFIPRHGTLWAEPKQPLQPKETKEGTSSRTLPDAQTEYDVVNAARKMKERELVFPNFIGKLESIVTWSSRTGFTITNVDPLTIQAIARDET